MTNSDIQFGEVQEAPPERRRRPDRDRHFAVVACGSLRLGDLPIFVDMDVMADMEAHALTNTNVELGGVLLGGQYVDEDGEPFVVVSDSLRATHYESSKGHFKFTHDTWSEISRRREEFADDLLIVGWYHTHPDWGVFLSGMDRFICDHFFNRPLDVALVIDPIRDDRGWFYWQRSGDERLPRSGGFHVTASRFRDRELRRFVAQFQDDQTMRSDRLDRGAVENASLVRSEVVHTMRLQFSWVAAAVMLLLVMQGLLGFVVAWRLMDTPATPEAPPTAEHDALDKLYAQQTQQFAALEEKLRHELELKQREAQIQSQRESLDRLLGHVVVDEEGQVNVDGLIEENQELHQENTRLNESEFLHAELRKNYQSLSQQYEETRQRLKEIEKADEELTGRNSQLRQQLEEMTQSRDRAVADANEKQEEIDRLSSGKDGQTPSDTGRGIVFWIIVVAIAVIVGVAAAVVGWILMKRKPAVADADKDND